MCPALSSCVGSQERLAAEEWGAVAMSMLGTIGLGVSTEEDEEAGQPAATLGVARAAVIALSLVVLLGGLVYGSRLTTPQKRRSAAGARTAASINGLQVRCRALYNVLAVWGRADCCITQSTRLKTSGIKRRHAVMLTCALPVLCCNELSRDAAHSPSTPLACFKP